MNSNYHNYELTAVIKATQLGNYSFGAEGKAQSRRSCSTVTVTNVLFAYRREIDTKHPLMLLSLSSHLDFSLLYPRLLLQSFQFCYLTEYYCWELSSAIFYEDYLLCLTEAKMVTACLFFAYESSIFLASTESD